MERNIMLTKPVFERLVEHLVSMEESSEELVNFYYPDLPIEQDKMKGLFENYIEKIEAELEKIILVDTIEKIRSTRNLNEFPFVIIGSQVNIIDLSSKTNISIKLIHPVEQSNQKNEITYLSSLGKALLLKEAGSEVAINLPSGLKEYKILSIILL